MKIALAQIKPIKGDIEQNIKQHLQLLNLAISKDADLVIFPELSLTAYEPRLAKDLAITKEDPRLDPFQIIADKHNVSIAIGAPTKSTEGILISMLIFQAGKARSIYSKQTLHADEYPYFVAGQQQVILEIGKHKIAPAICYESLIPEHAENCHKKGANIYLASVAKSAAGLQKALKYFPELAKKHSMYVLMSNSIGPCDDFESVGQSAIWNQEGNLIAQLEDKTTGVLIFDTITQATTSSTING